MGIGSRKALFFLSLTNKGYYKGISIKAPEELKQKLIQSFLSLYDIEPKSEIQDVQDSISILLDDTFTAGFHSSPDSCEKCGTTEFLCGHNKRQ
jgi:hypothetical protein